MKRIAIFCGSSAGNDPAYIEAGKALGVYLAQNNIELVFGGGKVGMMGIIADAVLENGGKAIGVIPSILKHKEVMHPGVQEMVVTRTMHKRKQIMYDLSEGFIALPGGYGTLDELFETITWSQLVIHQKPVAILNIEGFFNPLLDMIKFMVDKGFIAKINQEIIISDTQIEPLFEKMKIFKPIMEGKHYFGKNKL